MLRRASVFVLLLLTAGLLGVLGLDLLDGDSRASDPVLASEEYKLLDRIWRDPTYWPEAKWRELHEKVEKSPGKFVDALIAYYNREVKELAPYLKFVVLAHQGVLAPDQAVRPELAKRLELDDEGNLKMQWSLPPASPGAVAYHLLMWVARPTSYSEPEYEDASHVPFLKGAPREFHFAEIGPGWYPAILKSYGANVPKPLVEYLFQEYRVGAWQMFHDVHGEKGKLTRNEFYWAVHVLETAVWRIEHGFKERADVSSAQKELERLVNDSAWYTRRFAVHVLLKHPYFRTPELVKKLQEDPHPLVRERARALSWPSRTGKGNRANVATCYLYFPVGGLNGSPRERP